MSAGNLRVVSGMRPTGALHIGHYFGVLKNWAAMQEELESFFFVADWHALTSDYADTSRTREYVFEMVKDWIASGLDPEKAVLFRQSEVKETAELHLLLSMITPLGWLERCPTYKEQQQQLSEKDLSTYGFLGYPVLMTADVLAFRAKWVPVGHDQLPHLELSREICRRFNHLYGDYFPEPEAKINEAAKCPGLDGRKMSKSYGNAIYLKDSMEEITTKVKGMFTDPARLRRSDPGNPDNCNLYPYHELLTPEDMRCEIRSGCTGAQMGCVDCKKIMLERLGEFLLPLQERRARLDADPKLVEDVLEAGNAKARAEVRETMAGVRELMHMD